MILHQALEIVQERLLAPITQLYGLDGYAFELVEPHPGGRNLVFKCNSVRTDSRILRISYLNDRTREEYLAELEYVRFLHSHGASVADVLDSVNGNLLEEVQCDQHTFYVCLFERAKGIMLWENRYQYREGAPISEYFYNCGKVLGKMHALSKIYSPVHYRKSFFDHFNMPYLDPLIPDSLSPLKEKTEELLQALKRLPTNQESFGMLHFDYYDGNYSIDFSNGQITVFDFDNACFGHYMYDLADVWGHGVGWVRFEKSPERRKAFMESYFSTVVEGYRSETEISDSLLSLLPLFINATIMENIVDQLEVARNSGEAPDLKDPEFLYLVKCLSEDIPYRGFFSGIYSSENPFEWL